MVRLSHYSCDVVTKNAPVTDLTYLQCNVIEVKTILQSRYIVNKSDRTDEAQKLKFLRGNILYSFDNIVIVTLYTAPDNVL